MNSPVQGDGRAGVSHQVIVHVKTGIVRLVITERKTYHRFKFNLLIFKIIFNLLLCKNHLKIWMCKSQTLQITIITFTSVQKIYVNRCTHLSDKLEK